MSKDDPYKKRAQLVERNEDGSLTRETIKRAMKAFRKRLKLIRLDEESRLGYSPLSKGTESTIVGIRPPSQYPPEVWEELATLGHLRKADQGIFEIPDQGTA